MTLEQFRASKRWSNDLAAAVQSAPWAEGETVKGWLYLDALYIEQVQPDWPEATRKLGEWHLILGRDEWIDALAPLEERLYVWAVSEGYFEDADAEAAREHEAVERHRWGGA